MEWSLLPEEIVIAIYLYVNDLLDVYHAALTCRHWFDCFNGSQLWQTMTFNVTRGEQDAKQLPCIDLFGPHFRTVVIRVNQYEATNRDTAVQIIRRIAQCTPRRLHSLTVEFVGQNPLFYAGMEFCEALHVLFGPPAASVQIQHTLVDVNLSELSVKLTDDLFYALSQNNAATLRKLNIQNQQLICIVSADCMLTVVQRCRSLQYLSIFYASLSNEVLEALSSKDRAPLISLSLLCSAQDKYTWTDVRDDAWLQLRTENPTVSVTLRFDHRCPLLRIRELMLPSIPVRHLRLEACTLVDTELRLAAQLYDATLESLIVNAPGGRKIEEAILYLSHACRSLKSLRVYCFLHEEVVNKILSEHPGMKKLN